ncbi:MAG TPA: flagellar basal body rod C-terminal domain-containing protein [Patescibacteria group bacterium]|nr:flagellar basal body rod C-terminal domain-containing protein [Patescibacteria group bacterium]
MTDAMTIALSGLRAQTTRLAATASNIANATTGGAVPSADPSASASTLYTPVTVEFSSQAGGGVSAQVRPDPNAYSVIYDPSSGDANAEGLVAVPDVDLAEQAVNLIESKALYKANLSVIKTQDELLGDLLDAIA